MLGCFLFYLGFSKSLNLIYRLFGTIQNTYYNVYHFHLQIFDNVHRFLVFFWGGGMWGQLSLFFQLYSGVSDINIVIDLFSWHQLHNHSPSGKVVFRYTNRVKGYFPLKQAVGKFVLRFGIRFLGYCKERNSPQIFRTHLIIITDFINAEL